MVNECSKCKDAFSYNIGYKGKNADKHKIMLVLHRSDSRALEPTLFNDYENALFTSQTGKILCDMLDYCWSSHEDVLITNFVKCLFPEDRFPKKKEYENCLRNLEKQVEEFQPKKIIAFGTYVCQHMFPECKNISEKVGEIIPYKKIPTYLSYHPAFIWKMRTRDQVKHYESINSFLNQFKEKEIIKGNK